MIDIYTLLIAIHLHIVIVVSGIYLGNYLFINVEDCINSPGNVICLTYEWDEFKWIDDDMQLCKCNYSTTSTPTTSFPTNTPHSHLIMIIM
eukprot:UN10302